MNEEELDLNLDFDQIDANADRKLQVKNRFQQLSDKVKLEAQEKEKAQAEAKANAERVAALEKQASFYKDFSQLSSKHPGANEYQAQILEKVNAGMTTEDATLLVLAKEGRLAPQAPPSRNDVEGGSSITNVAEGDKAPNEMSINEKLSQLQELEKSGELNQALRAGINRS